MRPITSFRFLPLRALLRVVCAFTCVAVIASPSLAQRRPEIIVVERTVAKMEKVAENTAAKMRSVVDRILDRASLMAGSEPDTQLLIRLFQSRQFSLQVLSFQAQQRLAQMRQSALKRLENLEMNPEASQMLESAFTEAQNRLQNAFSNNQTRLQSIFTVASAIPPQEPNGLRPTGLDQPDLSIEGGAGDDQ